MVGRRILKNHFSILLICLVEICQLRPSRADTFAQRAALQADLVKKSSLSTLLRPLFNQYEVLNVSAVFWPVSIVEVNEVSQSFTVNGLFKFSWRNDILQWNYSAYGNVFYINLHADVLWKPRFTLQNAVRKRDPFKEDPGSVSALATGLVSWTTGGLFTTSCDLDLTNFPFDEQKCMIKVSVRALSTFAECFIPYQQP